MDYSLAFFDPERWSAVPFHFWTITFFIWGTIVGSFLNVCIYRLPIGESIVSPPSHCPHCKYHIPWYLNMPIITWIVLRGKCANCKAPISSRYILVETLTGVLFALSWLCVGKASPILAVIYVMVISGLIVASFIDFEHFIIPDGLTIGGIVIGFILSILCPVLHQSYSAKVSLEASILGIAVGGGGLYLISRLGKLAFGRYKLPIDPGDKAVFTEETLTLGGESIPYSEVFYRSSDYILVEKATSVSLTFNDNQPEQRLENVRVYLTPKKLKIDKQEWEPKQIRRMELETPEMLMPREVMGLGDVKLMAAVGAFFGWQSVIFTLFASSLIGSVVGIILICLKKQELSSRLPYGPYIAMGTILWMLGGFYYVTKWIQDMGLFI